MQLTHTYIPTMKRYLILACLTCALSATAERINIDDNWRFAFGNTDPAKDFGTGTEYFNYLTKAASIHNAGPYAVNFNDSAWAEVQLPHDFVVDLPFAREASHSHGYKTVGYKYPATSVGWYRKHLPINASDSLKRISLTFDGIFRDSRVWVNGFYLGGEPSGYAQQTYDITPTSTLTVTISLPSEPMPLSKRAGSTKGRHLSPCMARQTPCAPYHSQFRRCHLQSRLSRNANSQRQWPRQQ